MDASTLQSSPEAPLYGPESPLALTGSNLVLRMTPPQMGCSPVLWHVAPGATPGDATAGTTTTISSRSSRSSSSSIITSSRCSRSFSSCYTRALRLACVCIYVQVLHAVGWS